VSGPIIELPMPEDRPGNTRKLRIYINPNWSIHGYEDIQDLPEGWDDWPDDEQQDYIQDWIWQQIEDSGGKVIVVDADGNTIEEGEAL
jgi:hypothetical protein